MKNKNRIGFIWICKKCGTKTGEVTFSESVKLSVDEKQIFPAKKKTKKV